LEQNDYLLIFKRLGWTALSVLGSFGSALYFRRAIGRVTRGAVTLPLTVADRVGKLFVAMKFLDQRRYETVRGGVRVNVVDKVTRKMMNPVISTVWFAFFAYCYSTNTHPIGTTPTRFSAPLHLLPNAGLHDPYQNPTPYLSPFTIRVDISRYTIEDYEKSRQQIKELENNPDYRKYLEVYNAQITPKEQVKIRDALRRIYASPNEQMELIKLLYPDT
jgi:hypothetical protein